MSFRPATAPTIARVKILPPVFTGEAKYDAISNIFNRYLASPAAKSIMAFSTPSAKWMFSFKRPRSEFKAL